MLPVLRSYSILPGYWGNLCGLLCTFTATNNSAVQTDIGIFIVFTEEKGWYYWKYFWKCEK